MLCALGGRLFRALAGYVRHRALRSIPTTSDPGAQTLASGCHGRSAESAASGPAQRGFSLAQAAWMAGPLRPPFEHLMDRVASEVHVVPEAVRHV